MSTTIERASELRRSGTSTTSTPTTTLQKILLACGVAYGVVYIVANDMIAATIYDGYSRIDQAISELSATEAPSRDFLTVMLPIFALLVLGFGIGVWRSAAGNRALRAVGGILVAQAVMFPLWLLAPMTSREEIAAGAETASNDTGHIILTTFAVLFIVTEMGFAAAALGKRFRLFSLVTLVAVLVFGIWTGVLAPNVATGDPTPWMGFVERVSYWSWLLWMSVLSIALLRTRSDALTVTEAPVKAHPSRLVPGARLT